MLILIVSSAALMTPCDDSRTCHDSSCRVNWAWVLVRQERAAAAEDAAQQQLANAERLEEDLQVSGRNCKARCRCHRTGKAKSCTCMM